MIISNKDETHDKPWRLVMFNKNEDGTCTPDYVESEYNEEIKIFYQQRAVELKRLHADVIEGRLSTIGFFIKLQNMNIKDVASRMKLRPRVIEKHMTPEGFLAVRVDELKKYARIFDVSVSDFFEFTYIDDTVTIDSKWLHSRLINQATVRINDGTTKKDAAHE